MADVASFPYVHVYPALGEVGFRPEIQLTLISGAKRLQQVEVLLDTGSTVNVLPYTVGETLGAIWKKQTQHVQLTGNLAHYEARGLILEAVIGAFKPVELIFAWTRQEHIPVIMGQFNFFVEFDVCFFRTRRIIEISPRTPQ